MTMRARETAFKPKPTPAESKAEAAFRIARSMIETEVALRDAKTARLREARLAKEAAEIKVAGQKAEAGEAAPVRKARKR